MKYVFGPVPSRRLGQSLGIDTIPLKTCNWNCVYCQLGRTLPLTNERKEYYPKEEIFREVLTALESLEEDQPDWITFVGSGEPTLHSGIGWLIGQVKKNTPFPVAVISNGATLYLPEVRKALLDADAVLPSLDAGTPELYKKINRPHGEVTFQRLVEGLSKFSREFSGQLWVEVMLVKDLNDTEDALRDLAQVIEKVNPDQVHLVQPTRPPAESWVEPPDPGGLLRAQAILGKTAETVHPARGTFQLSSASSLTEAVTGIISRHPMKEEELIETLEHWSPKEVKKTLETLLESGQAQVITRYGVRFWAGSSSFYPDLEQSQKTQPAP